MTDTDFTAQTKLGIGIDTGGTFTDAVLIDLTTNSVLGAAKAPTTHHDVAIGITRAIDALIKSTQLNPDQIADVYVSTTLATNAVLENRGARVGLFVIGYNKPLTLPVLTTKYLHGGHTFSGTEEEPLDIETLLDTVIDYRDQVDAYAVCSSMSMKNPAHEMVAEKAIQMSDPKPVFLSHRYSSFPGIEARSATAVMNARLYPVMQRFTEGVRSALANRGIAAEIRILRGDTTHSLMDDTTVSAAETFASGPAATTLFGMAHTDEKDVLVIDVGGTSTDITLIRDGQPLTTEGGSRIGKWETHINAIDMHTIGIGGDSHIAVQNNSSIATGPHRVIPVSMAENIPDPSTWLGRDNCASLIQPGTNLGDASDPILNFLKEYGPSTPQTIKDALKLGEMPMYERLQTLFRHQVIQQIGFTPTDALHVLNELSMGNAEAACISADILAKCLHVPALGFCHQVMDQVTDQIRDAVLSYVIRREMGLQMTAFLSKCNNTSLLDVDFKINMPMIGIGAASHPILPRVAKKLSTTVSFPDHYAVGNAIGAVPRQNTAIGTIDA